MSEGIAASDELIDLALFALDHGVESIKDAGGPLVAFAVTEGPDGRNLVRFPTERVEEGPAHAREHIRGAGDPVRVAIAYDGYVTVEGERTDAILVEAQERGQPASVIMAQRYRPGGRLRRFSTIGNAAFLGDGESLL
jgi:nucleotide-binding universal stress UspA family protein